MDMDKEFDDLTRRLGDDSISRRWTLAVIGSSLVGALGSLAVFGDAEAHKKKRKRKKKKNPPPLPAPLPPAGVPITCFNQGTACGQQTQVCRCTLSKETHQVCLNLVQPPNGAAFQTCQQTVNCPPGEFCDAAASRCRNPCQTGNF